MLPSRGTSLLQNSLNIFPGKNLLLYQILIDHLLRHERQLHFVFSKMDSNKSGRVTSKEIKNAFNNLGINIGSEEAEKLVARLDDDNSLDISFEEWRDYLLFHPSSNMDEIIKYWRRESHLNQGVDHGEDVGTPGEIGFCFLCPYFFLLCNLVLFTLYLPLFISFLLDVQNFVWKTMSVHTGLLSLGEKPNKPRLKAFSVFFLAFFVLHSALLQSVTIMVICF